ncbi:MAG: type II toxin-antitoxin system RelE/ParE family toxin [candidate division KSB1 bacterium]|nr:type II toxin-antitoxin system RelE/ParE family toxin [candidate division KSB1 bacterium]
MEVQFRTRKLQKQYENSSEAERSYGKDVARKYIQRINIIKQSRDINELALLPGLHCHLLKSDRKSQWAIKLSGFYRLIFTVKGELLNNNRISELATIVHKVAHSQNISYERIIPCTGIDWHDKEKKTDQAGRLTPRRNEDRHAAGAQWNRH